MHQHRPQVRRAVSPTPVIAPGEQDQLGFSSCGPDDAVIAWSDGLWGALKIPWISGSPAEEIDDLQATEAPGFGKAHAAADRRVILGGIGGARVEHDEQNTRTFLDPNSLERVSVLATAVKLRAAPERRLEIWRGQIGTTI